MPPLGMDLLMALLPPWGIYLMMGFILLGLVSCTGFILARLGFKPIWALCVVIPVVQIAFFWQLAFVKWPREATKQVLNKD